MKMRSCEAASRSSVSRNDMSSSSSLAAQREPASTESSASSMSSSGGGGGSSSSSGGGGGGSSSPSAVLSRSSATLSWSRTPSCESSAGARSPTSPFHPTYQRDTSPKSGCCDSQCCSVSSHLGKKRSSRSLASSSVGSSSDQCITAWKGDRSCSAGLITSESSAVCSFGSTARSSKARHDCASSTSLHGFVRSRAAADAAESSGIHARSVSASLWRSDGARDAKPDGGSNGRHGSSHSCGGEGEGSCFAFQSLSADSRRGSTCSIVSSSKTKSGRSGLHAVSIATAAAGSCTRHSFVSAYLSGGSTTA
mmetsp:Transcript_15012/g.32049  ORF Transcript_15012/g.32049 Transcript_15012/m.32049 type:complete len:309 (-) Transcript_15012:24-950(-)